MTIKSAYCFCFNTNWSMAGIMTYIYISHNDGYSDINNPYSQENLTRVVNKLVTDTLINWIKLCWFICDRRTIYKKKNTLIACMYYKALYGTRAPWCGTCFAEKTVSWQAGADIIKWDVDGSISAWRFGLLLHVVVPLTNHTSATTHEFWRTGLEWSKLALSPGSFKT